MPPFGGLYLLDVVPDGEPRFGFPNISDNAELVELIACGSHVILFTTGRGSVVGSAVSPVIKVCANPETYRKLGEDMDVDAGRIIEGAARCRSRRGDLRPGPRRGAGRAQQVRRAGTPRVHPDLQVLRADRPGLHAGRARPERVSCRDPGGTVNYQFDFAAVLEQWPLLLDGAWVTIKLSFCATVLGFVLGTLCALARLSRRAWLRRLAGAYVEAIRNTPLLVQSYFLIFGLSSAGVTLPIMAGAVLALVINIGAYTCEIMRAGIESIHKGQLEAGECLALSPRQVFWHVVLRPAVERVYPSLTSQFVLLMLASSIMSAVGAEELLAVANRIQSDTYRNFEVFVVLWGLYLALSLLMRAGFWLLARFIFPRRRKLGTPL